MKRINSDELIIIYDTLPKFGLKCRTTTLFPDNNFYAIWHGWSGHFIKFHKQPWLWILEVLIVQLKKPTATENNLNFALAYKPQTEIRVLLQIAVGHIFNLTSIIGYELWSLVLVKFYVILFLIFCRINWFSKIDCMHDFFSLLYTKAKLNVLFKLTRNT